jgi:hypothetical protein
MFTEMPFARRVPDGGVLRLFKRAAPTGAPEQFLIDFGGIVALTADVTTKTADAATVQYRWRRIQFGSREYWTFTHLIDSAGRIVAQLDQPLGADAVQEVQLRIPADARASALRWRFGIYHPQSGERLHVGPLPTQLASRFVLGDEGTALITPY